MSLRVDDFDYELPSDRIAQAPATPRDSSRLLHLNRESGAMRHLRFYDLPRLLAPGDLLVLNDTKVMPARLYGEKSGTGGSVEALLLRRMEADVWEALVRPGRRLRRGTRLSFGKGALTGEIVGELPSGVRLVRFEWESGTFEELLDRLGQMPLPPYITESLADPDRYQTVYAEQPGSAAAPTAGLHFTERLLAAVAARGVKIARITLHVGLGTFRPVQVERVAEHTMHPERFLVTAQVAEAINRTRADGGRIVAVGTTVARTLEAVADERGTVRSEEGSTDIFIYPGYQFKCVDALITNFHLPRSTLLMLVCAFADRETILSAYDEAIRSGYRFYSFGDAMLID